MRLNNMAEYEALKRGMSVKGLPFSNKENKFHAKTTEADGIKFGSKKEARIFRELILPELKSTRITTKRR